jgi:hypothetical protein
MVNSNLRGERFIKKVLPLAKATNSRNSSTPSNIARIKAMLKVLIGRQENVRVENIIDEQVEDDYKSLKTSARGIYRAFVADHPNSKGLSWSKLGQVNPTVKNQLILNLEKKAYDSGINIHFCEDMWAADRLLFEAFRGSRSKGNNNSFAVENSSSDSNNNPSSRRSRSSSCSTEYSTASALKPNESEKESFS